MDNQTWAALIDSLTFEDSERPWRIWTSENERFAYWDEPIDQESHCDYCSEPGADRIYQPAGYRMSRYFVHRTCLDAHMREEYEEFMKERDIKHVGNLMRLLAQAKDNYPDRKREIEEGFGNIFFGQK